jgi:hypothetical protein
MAFTVNEGREIGSCFIPGHSGDVIPSIRHGQMSNLGIPKKVGEEFVGHQAK